MANGVAIMPRLAVARRQRGRVSFARTFALAKSN